MSALAGPEEGPAIALSGVHKHYSSGRHDVHALRGIDLVIQAGEFVAIMGPSGSGKTTLMEILGCLSQPSAGSYRMHGAEVGRLGPDELAQLRGREIGFVFQSFHLLPRLDLTENVALPLLYARVPRARRRARAREALDRVGLGHRAGHRPTEISGGERQRTAIARALVNEPSLLLADEPTGNLDSERGREILEILRGVHGGGATLVVVTHDASIGECAERCIRIRDGRLEDGPGPAA